MPIEREVVAAQEREMYRILMIQTLLDSGDVKGLRRYIKSLRGELNAGMTTTQVDAVKERVRQAIEEDDANE